MKNGRPGEGRPLEVQGDDPNNFADSTTKPAPARSDETGQRRERQPDWRPSDTRTQTQPPSPLAGGPIEIAKFWKNRKGDAIRLELREYEGHSFLDLRQCYTDRDGKLAPSKKGLTVGLPKLQELSRAIVKAIAKAQALGLLKTEATP